MSKVEEVAAACRSAVDRAGELERSVSFEEMSFFVARAAIEAMKEPDVEMLAAFWRQKNNGTQEIGESGDNRSDYDAWRAAMSRALNEEG